MEPVGARASTGAVNVTVLPGSMVTSNPPAVVSAETVCCTAVLFLTVTVAPAFTGDVVNMKPLPPLPIVIAGTAGRRRRRSRDARRGRRT